MKIIISFYFSVLFCSTLNSQNSIIPVNTLLTENELSIKYDLSKITSKTCDIQLTIKNKKGKILIPLEIYGDLRNVKPEKNKQIICKLNPNDKIKENYSVELLAVNPIDSTIIYNPKIKYGYVIDNEKNTYITVKIGNKTWMAENLRKTHFNNGEKINFTENKENWKPSNQGVACAYNFDSITYKKQGYYYSWRIVNDKRGICPIGWNVPKDTEWKLLAKELKNDQVPIKLIENNPLHWKNIIDTTNQNNVGFTAIPSGLVKEDGSFQDIYTTSYWWSNSIFFDIFSCYFKIDLEKQIHDHPNGNQNLGMPIRCVKD